MTLTIPISRFRRLLFAVLQAIAPARASAAAHAQLSQLYDRWGTAVFRAAYAYLHNKSDAEDVLQDTFLQYMRTSPELESPAHEKAWLLRVAINLSKNKLNSAWFKRTDTLKESYPCADLGSNLAFMWDSVRALPSSTANPFICSIMKGILPRKSHAFSDRRRAPCVLCFTEAAVCSKRH